MIVSCEALRAFALELSPLDRVYWYNIDDEKHSRTALDYKRRGNL